MIKLVAFDLDGTLAESKQPLAPEMAELLCPLLKRYQVAVVSGAAFERFERQLLSQLSCPYELLSNLFLFPLNGSAFYRFQTDHFENVYLDEFTPEQKKAILDAFHDALKKQSWKVPAEPYGELIEDRGAQITFSGLGQNAPLELKRAWDPNLAKRNSLAAALRRRLPSFEVGVAGLTSVDITKAGVNKAHAIRQICAHLNLAPTEILFVGDALFPGGNDTPAKTTGVDYRQIKDPEDTIAFIRELISS